MCVCVFFTQVVVFRDSCSCPGARSLLGEVVAELHDALVLFQHFSDLHLNTGSQLLSLEHTDGRSGRQVWALKSVVLFFKEELKLILQYIYVN